MTRQKRSATALLTLFLLINSIFDWQAFAAPQASEDRPAAPEAHVAEAQPAVRRIGLASAPGGGAFQAVLDAAPEAVSRAFLVYELAGVSGWTATVRSINGLPAEGGFGAVPASGTALQVEEINPRWLRQGLNRIVFLPAPAAGPAPSGPASLRERDGLGAPDGSVPYTVRNLRIVYLDGAVRPAPRLRITHPVKGEGEEAGAVLRGFVEPASLPAGPAELFVNGAYVPGAVSQPDGSFAVFVPRSAPDGEAWAIEVEVVYPDGTRIRRTVAVRPVGGKPESQAPKGEDDEDAAAKALSEQTDAKAGAVDESSVPLPDEPAGESFSPNSIRELAKADPAAEIVQIAPPEAGPAGDARLGFPLVVPPGRHGLHPDLAIEYNSANGDGWLGLGWDLRLPSIEVSTLFGVPRYDGSERYLIDGDQLAATSDPGVFVRRVEGPFQRIFRRGDGPASYWWEVTDKDGVRHVYGQSAQARLRDPRTGDTFRWLLERTVDLHGNTVDYTYATDSGADGEPWVQVYPARIDYTGVQGQGAFYHVVFGLDGGERPDRISSGRPGFKTYTRRRLATVDVLAGDALVRRYALQYRVGDFQKSLLEAVAVTGEGGAAEFYRHTFDYIPMAAEGDGYAGFAEPQAWGGLRGSADFSSSFHIGGGAHGFAGLGPPECQPHAGVQAGGGGTDTSVRVRFLDVNGDGLPDRLDENGNVDLNRYDPAADPAGTGPGRFDSASFPGAATLEHTSEWSLDVGIGVHAELGITAALDTSWAWNHSNDDRVMADVNGDGRPDLVSTADGFGVRINDGNAFRARSDWSGYGAGGLSLGNPQEEEDVKEGFRLSDALRQLRLPFSGRVTLGGAVQKKAAGGDGVTASIYRNGSRVWRHEIASSDTTACAPGPGDSCGGGLSLDVNAGDSLYFLAGSRRETSADALLWAPVVAYDGTDTGAREPYGARVYVFDGAGDFRLAGYKGASWASPAAGTVRLTGPIVKQVTSDDVVVTVARSRDLLSPVYSRRLGASETGTFDEVPPIEVRQGEALFLRVSSTTPVDSARVQWTPTATFEGATDPGQLPDELRTQKARVLFAVPRLLPANDPTRSWIAPSTGEKTFAVSWDPKGTSGAVLYVQGVNRLLDRRELPASKTSFSVKVNASGGEPVFFTLLVRGSGDAGELKIDGGVPVNRRYPSDAEQNVLSGGWHGWFYGDWNGDVPFSPAGLTPPADEEDTASYVPGVPHPEGTDGFGEPAWTASGFDLYLAAEGVKPSRQGANAAGILDQASGAAPGGGLSVLRKTSAKTWGAEAGAGAGLAISLGESRTDVDLLDMNGDRYPDQVSSSGVRFSNGRDGFGPLAGFPGMSSAVRSSDEGSVSTSIGLGLNFTKKNGQGETTGVLSTLPSVGSTVALSQVSHDLVDVNGDGLPDRVSMPPGSGAVQVELNLGYRFGAPESWSLPKWDAGVDRCQDAVDYLSSGIAGITSLDTLNGLSFTRSSALHAGVAFGPFGGGAVTTLARTLVDLADVNGDGLPDHVSKEQGEDFFRVKLNLGDRWDGERPWYVPGWGTSIGDGYNPLDIFSCLDALSFNGNVEGQGSIGAPICIPLIPPTPVVGLQIEISAQGFGSTGSGLQLFLQDLDGDGLADHVLKKAGDPNVYVKRNQAERVNLLSGVHRPLG
ncbi:MAG: SpvB/TcaC N-terminal domain-containing protein, partial [Thermoanaerobaculia bacterium]